MTIQLAKDQAAQEADYKDFDDAFGDCQYIDIDEVERIINRSLEIYAEAKAKEAYSQGVKDWEAANEKANKILDGLREKSKYVEAYNQGVRDAAENAMLLHKELDKEAFNEPYKVKELVSWECIPDYFEVSKQSILKLLK